MQWMENRWLSGDLDVVLYFSSFDNLSFASRVFTIGLPLVLLSSIGFHWHPLLTDIRQFSQRIRGVQRDEPETIIDETGDVQTIKTASLSGMSAKAKMAARLAAMRDSELRVAEQAPSSQKRPANLRQLLTQDVPRSVSDISLEDDVPD